MLPQDDGRGDDRDGLDDHRQGNGEGQSDQRFHRHSPHSSVSPVRPERAPKKWRGVLNIS
jgi:hypothetical protein